MSTEPIAVKGVTGIVELTGIGRDRVLQAVREGELKVHYPHRSPLRYIALVEDVRAWVKGLPTDAPQDP
jgi:hypothetical protein